MFIDIWIDILTWHFDFNGGEGEEEGRKEGVDFSLKSNNPTPTGGEQTNLWIVLDYKPRCQEEEG